VWGGGGEGGEEGGRGIGGRMGGEGGWVVCSVLGGGSSGGGGRLCGPGPLPCSIFGRASQGLGGVDRGGVGGRGAQPENTERFLAIALWQGLPKQVCGGCQSGLVWFCGVFLLSKRDIGGLFGLVSQNRVLRRPSTRYVKAPEQFPTV
jgi:hypothetical protein